MDDTQYKERIKRLEEVNKVIEKLDPAIREHAFDILKGYITGGKDPGHKAEDDVETEDDISSTVEQFFSRFENSKPADNALILAAYQYSQFGSAPFSIEEVEQLAVDVGFTIANRVDMTYVQAKREGKNLFRKVAKGQFKPTVHGETFLRNTYKVGKGKKKKQPSEKEQ